MPILAEIATLRISPFQSMSAVVTIVLIFLNRTVLRAAFPSTPSAGYVGENVRTWAAGFAVGFDGNRDENRLLCP